jgi:flagellar protein FlbD
VILLTRLDGSRIGLNEDQIERLDETPDTVVTMANGNSYLVAEPLEEVVDRIAEFQARSRSAGPAVTRPRRRTPARRAAHLQLAGDQPHEPEEH